MLHVFADRDEACRKIDAREEYKKGGIKVDPAFRERMMQEEIRMQQELQNQIHQLLAGQD